MASETLLIFVLMLSSVHVGKSAETKYSCSIITSEPKEIKDGGAVDLYCRASGGYPAGTIHWFDQRNTNWTKNSTLQITQGHDGLFTLSSKLSFRSINTTWGPFRCVVLNYRYEEEGENTTALERRPLFKMKCQSAVGVIGQTTNICCNIESQTDPADIVTGILTFKENRIYMYTTFRSSENNGTGDSRFQVKSLPSLQLHNTSISDVGEYKYFIQSTRGADEAEFKITANYSCPIITSEPKEIEDGGPADLYCNASGGYPAGTIHWFDQRNTNWTKNSTLQITQGHDGLFTLSSKLSFRSIDTIRTPFRCVVHNYRYEEEGESMTALWRKAALFKMKCQSAVGVIGQTTNICCNIESQTDPADIVTGILMFKENRIYMYTTFRSSENNGTGDSRFQVKSLPSLQLHNTSISDVGEYKYFIQSTRGADEAEFKITANYSSPIITSEPKEIEDGGPADLYCRASGGYPAGTIHWFDQRNTNWTQNSTLQITQGHDGLFTLSSKLSFRSIDTTWGPFRCVVLNYRYEEEGGSMTAQGRKGDPEIAPGGNSTLKIIMATVVLIGSLIVCLLIVVLVKLRVIEKLKKARSMDYPILSAIEPVDVNEE